MSTGLRPLSERASGQQSASLVLRNHPDQKFTGTTCVKRCSGSLLTLLKRGDGKEGWLERCLKCCLWSSWSNWTQCIATISPIIYIIEFSFVRWWGWWCDTMKSWGKKKKKPSEMNMPKSEELPLLLQRKCGLSGAMLRRYGWYTCSLVDVFNAEASGGG